MTELIALTIIFLFPAFLIIFRNFLWDLYFWEIKEYRFDRFWTHIFWDQDEKNRNHTVTLIKYFLFACVSLMLVFPELSLIGVFLSFFIWLNESLNLIATIHSGNFKRPSLKSPRNILIMTGLLILLIATFGIIVYPFTQIERDTTAGIYLNTPTDESSVAYPDAYLLLSILTLFALLFDLGSVVFVTIFVYVTKPFAYIRRQLMVRQASRIFKQHKKNLTTIAITGSQGKTTTKELMYELIKDEFNTLKTPENYNTDFGIASIVKRRLNNNHQIFIAEMGAYKRGEIAKVCKYFTPNISVITDMDTQHLGLFGSKENLFRAKSEIVTHMNPDGTAILNGDNDDCRRILNFFHGTVHFFSTECKSEDDFFKKYKIKRQPQLFVHIAKDIKTKGNVTTLTYIHQETETKIRFNTASSHLVSNLLISLIAAQLIGISLKDLSAKLNKTKFHLPRLNLETGINNTAVLNDSYSSSLKGFIAAVELMHKKSTERNIVDLETDITRIGKRIVVTKGIYELGRSKKMVYETLVEQIYKKIDVLITTDHLLARLMSSYSQKIDCYLAVDHKDMIFKTEEIANPGDIILIEGRVHPEVLKSLVSENY